MENGPEHSSDIRSTEGKWIGTLWVMAALGLGSALVTQFMGSILGGIDWQDGLCFGCICAGLWSSVRLIKQSW